MSVISMIIVAVIAALHLYIMWFEMFKWTSRGPKVFKSFPRELFEPTKVMAANQGLYNGFLAAGLLWSLFIADPVWQTKVACCFLLIVLVAGIYGALTAARNILFVQVVPAAAGLLSLYFT
jgi:putative membrane protein